MPVCRAIAKYPVVAHSGRPPQRTGRHVLANDPAQPPRSPTAEPGPPHERRARRRRRAKETARGRARGDFDIDVSKRQPEAMQTAHRTEYLGTEILTGWG